MGYLRDALRDHRSIKFAVGAYGPPTASVAEPVRLGQEVDHLLSRGRYFDCAGVVVAPEVTLAKLIFYGDERRLDEALNRGWYGSAAVELATGERHVVEFNDPVRPGQTVEITSTDRRLFAEAAVIVLPEVTRENMEAAVEQLANEGFFSKLSTIDR